jgi:hypothetical protein
MRPHRRNLVLEGGDSGCLQKALPGSTTNVTGRLLRVTSTMVQVHACVHRVLRHAFLNGLTL